jgi:hypothetical protein
MECEVSDAGHALQAVHTPPAVLHDYGHVAQVGTCKYLMQLHDDDGGGGDGGGDGGGGVGDGDDGDDGDDDDDDASKPPIVPTAHLQSLFHTAKLAAYAIILPFFHNNQTLSSSANSSQAAFPAQITMRFASMLDVSHMYSATVLLLPQLKLLE